MNQEKDRDQPDHNREKGTLTDVNQERAPGGTESEQNLPGQRRPVGSGEYRPEQGSVEKKR